MTNPRIEFFDSIATKWDGWIDPDKTKEMLKNGLKKFSLTPTESVVDMGCGTGNLTQSILSILGPSGSVFAVDISPKMLQTAQEKIFDPRVNWVNADAAKLPIENETVDRAVFYSVWPHFHHPKEVIKECRRYLKPKAFFHIWHSDSKDTINRIHTNAGVQVQRDILLPAIDLVDMIKRQGFKILDLIDDDKMYLITARKD